MSAVFTFGAQQPSTNWIVAGSGGILPAHMDFATPTGRVGVLLASGARGHEGSSFLHSTRQQRACVTCHQPAYGMSFSAEAARQLCDLHDRPGARADAERVVDILKGLGTNPSSIRVYISPEVAKPDGINDPQNRLLTIRVIP